MVALRSYNYIWMKSQFGPDTLTGIMGFAEQSTSYKDGEGRFRTLYTTGATIRMDILQSMEKWMNVIHFSFSLGDNFLSIVQRPAQAVSYTSRSSSLVVVSGKLNIAVTNRLLYRLCCEGMHMHWLGNTHMLIRFFKCTNDKLNTCLTISLCFSQQKESTK